MRTLQRCTAHSYRDDIARRCFEHAATAGDLNLLHYDVTALYFEAKKEDDLRKVGYSKERRVDPQIVVGLLVDHTEVPLVIGPFEENHAETRTIVPSCGSSRPVHGIEGVEMVITADAGRLSSTNLKDLDAAGLKFIVESGVMKAPSWMSRWRKSAIRSRHRPTRVRSTSLRARKPCSKAVVEAAVNEVGAPPANS